MSLAVSFHHGMIVKGLKRLKFFIVWYLTRRQMNGFRNHRLHRLNCWMIRRYSPMSPN
jgi:hypothetical protein